MTEAKRINFAFVGDAPPEWMAQRSEQAIQLLREPRTGGVSRPRQIPSFRSMPSQQEPASKTLPIEEKFAAGGLQVRLTDVRVFSAGVAFRLVATDPSRTTLADSAALPNLSHRIMPYQRHRVRLVVDVPGGAMLTNAANQFDFPDDPDAAWLCGGSNGAHVTADGVEVDADYFLSPIPAGPGDIVITIAYPEFGLEPSCVVIDSARL